MAFGFFSMALRYSAIGLGVFALGFENFRRELIDAIRRRRFLVHAVDGVVPGLHVVIRRYIEDVGIGQEILFRAAR